MKRIALVAILITTASVAFAGDAGSDVERRARVAVKVGSHAATVGEIEDRIAEIPPFQIESYGASRNELVKAFVSQVIERELLLNAGADKRKLVDKYPTKQQWQRALSTATLRALRKDLKSPLQIPDADVAQYYSDNRARFESPERINLWRILCKTKDEATTVLAAAKKDLNVPKYQDLARDHSLDKATSFRGGNLGFVAPDGQSNEAGVKIDLELLKAVGTVKDGDLAPEPVPEGPNWSVVWRRTTVAATKRTLDEATAQIRSTIYRDRTEAAEKQLIDDLKKTKVTNYDAEPLKIIEFPAENAGLNLPRSVPPSVLPTAAPPSPPKK